MNMSSPNSPQQSAKMKTMVELHLAFHEEQARNLERDLNEITLGMAMHQDESETRRGVPLCYRSSLEGGISDAKRQLEFIRTKQASRAGRAPRPDPLQLLILQIVRKNVDINTPQLLARLKSLEGEGVIEEIDGDDVPKPLIHFGDNNRIKVAPVSGLKDRLSRAKKKIRN